MSTYLASLGWDAAFAAAHVARGRPDERPGRVSRVDRGVCTVLTAAGTTRASLSGGLLGAGARDPVALPCVGDWVCLRTWADGRITVETVLPRRTAIVRHAASLRSQGQVLAANLDAAAVVEPMHPAPDPGRIERMLALAWESGAPPLVVLTKADAAADPAAVAAQVAAVTPGVAVYPVSAVNMTGLDALRPLVAPGRTLALLGPSGAGKSTLVNALVGTEVMGIRALRADGRGRHTTTFRALVPLPGGGAVVDTPGIRSIGLLDGVDGLDRAFDDVAALASACRFADCAHGSEPGCAVRAALESGDLPSRRFDSWRRLQQELARELRRRDARLAADERNRWKQIRRVQRARGRP